MAKKQAKKKKAAIEITLWDVLLSYPDLSDPKPYKGKTYYSVDVLFDKKHPDLKKLQATINDVCTDAFGDDESEWPESIASIKNGNERQDSKGYENRYFIKASTNAEFGDVPVVNADGDKFNPKMVKGGMFGNVAVRVAAWHFDGDDGVSVYLQGVQVDTDKEPLNFGGGKSVKKMFTRDGDEEDEAPKTKKKSQPVDEEDDEPTPTRKKASSKAAVQDDEDEEEEAPRKSKKSRARDFDDEDEE